MACRRAGALVVCVGAVLGCRDAPRVPAPSFALLFPPVTGDLMTISSPNVADLDGDGVLDIVFGTGVERVRPSRGRMVFTGEPEVSGYVVAVSGATNAMMWRVPNPRDAFTTPRFARLNTDSVPDVVMGGREGMLSAFDGRNGSLLWRVEGKSVVATPFPYNFFTPAVIRDVNRDGVADIVATYGGNDTKMPTEPRDAGFLAVISGADGKVLRVNQTSDGRETYASPVVYERRDGSEWVIYGTGGETHGGAAYRAPVASLMDSTLASRAEPLVALGETKGVIAPPTLVDLTGDGELDILIATFDGRLVAVDGATAKPLWQREDRGEEAYHSPAVVRLDAKGRLGLFLSRGIGVFPKYVGSVHRLYNATDGQPLYEYRDPYYPGGAPLAVDLTGDGIDEPIFFSVRFPSAQGGRIHVFHAPTRTLITRDIEQTFWSTPIIADARGTGGLEMIGLSWRIATTGDLSAADPHSPSSDRGAPAWRNLQWQLLRMDLSTKAPVFRSWTAYMGTNADGQYRAPTARAAIGVAKP